MNTLHISPKPGVKSLLVLLGTLFLFSGVQAQLLNAYHDRQGDFYVCDNGTMKRMESFQFPIKDYKVSFTFMAYINNVGQLKVYENGYSRVVSENTPGDWSVTDHIMMVNTAGAMYVYYAGKMKKAGSFIQEIFPPLDSVVAFIDLNKNFTVYHKGAAQVVETLPVDSVRMGKNLVAYLNNMNQLHMWHRGEKIPLEVQPVTGVKCGLDVAAYVDFYNQFKVYYEGSTILMDGFAPREYYVGDKIVVWLNRNGNFMCFADGIPMEIESLTPQWFYVKDQMVVYSTPGNGFNVFWNGQKYPLESFTPVRYSFDNDMLAWVDSYNKLKVFWQGKIFKGSDRIPQSFEVYGSTVKAEVQWTRPEILVGDKVY